METSEVNFSKRNIINSDILEKCSFILNMKEFICMHQTMDPSDKSTYPAKWVWYLIMFGILSRIADTFSLSSALNHRTLAIHPKAMGQRATSHELQIDER
jgi:hypothetical protein